MNLSNSSPPVNCSDVSCRWRYTMRTRFVTAACDLGRVGLAATDRGVCAVSLADSDAELEAFLRAEFPGAELAHDEAALAEWAEQLSRHVAGSRPRLDLPLDVRA